jgi:hypothetical protein
VWCPDVGLLWDKHATVGGGGDERCILHFQIGRNDFQLTNQTAAIYLQTSHPTNSVEQNFSWETNSYSASQDFPRILWSPKVDHHFHYSPSPVPILSRIILIQTHPTSFLSTSTSDFHTITLNVPLLFFVRVTRLAHQIQEYLIEWTLRFWNLYHDLLGLGKYVIYCYSVNEQNAWKMENVIYFSPVSGACCLRVVLTSVLSRE